MVQTRTKTLLIKWNIAEGINFFFFFFNFLFVSAKMVRLFSTYLLFLLGHLHTESTIWRLQANRTEIEWVKNKRRKNKIKKKKPKTGQNFLKTNHNSNKNNNNKRNERKTEDSGHFYSILSIGQSKRRPQWTIT